MERGYIEGSDIKDERCSLLSLGNKTCLPTKLNEAKNKTPYKDHKLRHHGTTQPIIKTSKIH